MGLRKTGAWLGLVEERDEEFRDEDYTYEDAAEEDFAEEDPSGQVAMGNGFQIAMVRPRNFRDAATIGEYFRQDIPVIINLDDMGDPEAYRIVDFASGLILGRHGEIERLSRRVFLILPPNTTIFTGQGKLTDEGFFNQA